MFTRPDQENEKLAIGFVACHFYSTVFCVESRFEIGFKHWLYLEFSKIAVFVYKGIKKIYTKENLPVQ